MQLVGYEDLAGEVRACVGTRRPVLVGIAGAVAVGKSTTAAVLSELLAAGGLRTDVLCTDCFLHTNAQLAEKGLSGRKGFPESYDTEAMVAALRRLRDGDLPVAVPVYSHEVYDVVAGEVAAVGDADVVIVEGVNALQAPALSFYDLAIYIEAEEPDVRSWFVQRFLDLCEAAQGGNAAPFYRRFAELPDDGRAAVAEGAWEGINAPNLRHHIGPTRDDATFVVRKAADHTIVGITAPDGTRPRRRP